MVSGPEMARVFGEFEASTEKRKKLDHDIIRRPNMCKRHLNER